MVPARKARGRMAGGGRARRMVHERGLRLGCTQDGDGAVKGDMEGSGPDRPAHAL